jgi:uncharacterized protein YndB with AHSA1/START domain
MTTNSPAVVRVTHRFSAAAERVFDAWLDPDRARRFLFATSTGEIVRAEIDPRVGGRFNFTDRRDGEDVEHTGEYLEIDRPRRLVFTFAVSGFEDYPTRVTIEIVPLERGCELTLTHEGVLPEYAERTNQGWATILEGLAKAIE